MLRRKLGEHGQHDQSSHGLWAKARSLLGGGKKKKIFVKKRREPLQIPGLKVISGYADRNFGISLKQHKSSGGRIALSGSLTSGRSHAVKKLVGYSRARLKGTGVNVTGRVTKSGISIFFDKPGKGKIIPTGEPVE